MIIAGFLGKIDSEFMNVGSRRSVIQIIYVIGVAFDCLCGIVAAIIIN